MDDVAGLDLWSARRYPIDMLTTNSIAITRTGGQDNKLRDQAYSYIFQKLVDGKYPAGSRLTVSSLAKEIGVSRTPVAEALARLRIERVVESVPRVGTVVRKPSIGEIDELYELRELLEGYAAFKAAGRFDTDLLKVLDHILAKTREMCVEFRGSGERLMSPEDTRRYLALDMVFHSAILKAVDNQRMHKTVNDTRIFLEIFGIRRHDRPASSNMIEVYRWHRRIRNAIRRGDAEMAKALVARHISMSRKGAIEYLKLHEDEGANAVDLELDLKNLLPAGLNLFGKA